MDDLRYFGTYARLNTKSKKDATPLLGADSLVGDRFTIDIEWIQGHPIAWVSNKFGAKVGTLDTSVSYKLGICRARNWTIRAFLSFVAFTDTPESGYYWGEVALVCNDSHFDEAFDEFSRRISSFMIRGIRPEVSLSQGTIDRIIAHNGNLTIKERHPLPKQSQGTVILKQRRKLSEDLIEQARKGNKGCYAASWFVWLAIVAIILFWLHALSVF